MSLDIIRSGLLATVQDLGRPGYQYAGIPVGGALDAPALRLANLLIGNAPGEAGLEITLAGPTLRFARPHLLALTGADLSATLDGQLLPLGRPVAVRVGTTLAFGAARAGCRAYLALAGGLDLPPVLGSRATLVRANLGGLHGRALRAGDQLPAPGPAGRGQQLWEKLLAALPASNWAAAPWQFLNGWVSPPAWDPTPAPTPPGEGGHGGATVSSRQAPLSRRGGGGGEVTLRAVRGPEYDEFTSASRRAFWQQPYTITPVADRMGYRLAGPALTRPDGTELLSSAVAPGTVQVPPGGQPIVLLADCQTTGGYPRLAHVITADLPGLAQARPGQALRFQEVSLTEAQALYLAQARHLRQLEANYQAFLTQLLRR